MYFLDDLCVPHNNLPQFHTATTAMIKVRAKVSIIITARAIVRGGPEAPNF